MKYIKRFKLFESIQNDSIRIEEFVQRLGFRTELHDLIIDWWNKNRAGFKILYFPFSSPKPIAGVFLGVDTVAINSKLPMPSHIKLFLALHESRHCEQHKRGIFMSRYYDTVVMGDKGSFLEAYRELESDANDFAINAMREMGFEREMSMESQRLKSNERAGEMVYSMMTDDIRLLNPVDFIDLLKKQVGIR